MSAKIKKIVEKYDHDRTRLVDMLRDVQTSERMISDESIKILASELKLSQVDVRETATFYHFFSSKHTGEVTIYLNNSVTSELAGLKDVAATFEKEAGIKFGETTSDHKIGLRYTACMGMCDQEPAALINGTPFTKLTPDKAKKIIKGLRSQMSVSELVDELGTLGDGANGTKRVMSMVNSNIQKKGEVFFKEYVKGSALEKALSMTQENLIKEIKISNLLGRGGAGFPTGMKWQFALDAKGEQKYVICNADEGEPGTFKDRILLTEFPALLFEGMAIAGYAVGATKGMLYLRMEYTYLLEHLNKQLEDFRENKLLGKKICGKPFNFDIEVRLGAGAYVCGEETALIESLEGKRGEPRNKPPFPIQSGYMGRPTLVNNVETLCAAAQIVKFGGEWYKKLGTERTSGTKLLSVSGDVGKPGIYEVQWGLTVGEFLKMVDAKDPRAIVVGGPSGRIIKATETSRKFATEDLPTAGAMIVLNSQRDILGVVHNYMEFFTEESCGACLPCRGGNVLLTEVIEKIQKGLGSEADLKNLVEWSKLVKSASRCGLGQASSQPILTTLENFRGEYEKRIKKSDGLFAPFDLHAAEETYNQLFK